MPEQFQLTLDFVHIDVMSVEEIWALASAKVISRLKEDRRIERKPVGIHGAELAEYFSMWANTIDGGLIAVGVENDGTVSGCARQSTNTLETQARTLCPDATVETKRVVATRDDDGEPDYILLLRVRYNDHKVVRTAKGDAFIRVGDQKRRLHAEQIRELEAAKGQIDIELEPCAQYKFPDDFEQSLIESFIASVRERHPNYPDRLTTTEVLELRRLGKRQGDIFIPNTACVLMFARDPLQAFPGCKIRFLRYEGAIEKTGTKYNVVKDIILEGPIPLIIEEAADTLRQQLREFRRLGPDGKFLPVPEYPHEAWFEAIVNACVHRSYGVLRNMNIFIRMFDDRLEFESPGGFPPPVTPETIYEMHQPRNPHLIDAMLHLNYAQCAREGARRMRESMNALDLPSPLFSQREDAYDLVRVLLRNNSKQRSEWVDADVAAVIGPEKAQTLTEHERRTVNFIAEHKKAHASEISRLLGIDWQTARKMLERLVSRDILLHVHRKDILRDPKAHFIIAPQKETER
jgi:ATP-dependent DNA helicase RecG